MKLSEKTVGILENFSTINSGVVIKQGKVLKTISTNKAILAEAQIDEEFPREFGIYDLNKLLGVLSLHDSPDIEFEEHCLSLGGVSGRSKTRIRYTEPKLIASPPNKNINIPSYDVKFTFSQDDLIWVEKIGSILKCPYFVVSNEDNKIVVSAMDVKGEVVDDSSLTVGEYNDPNPFKFVLKVENLKLLKGTYIVELSSRGVAKFSNQNIPIVYHVAVEVGASNYGKKD
jgi:hypothetical protein